MAESITISKLPPPLRSMQYSQLREEGLRRIQELSGVIWNDNNAHDPGITILEVLAYAITDLGYRTNYDIRDILTPNPALPADIRNFFTAAQILPNGPVTYNDYRKLLMDVEVVFEELADPYAGVKNAWIEISPENELPFYLDHVGATLSYDSSIGERIYPKVLYDVMLEFDWNESLGDLNENVIRGRYVVTGIPDISGHANLNGSIFDFELEMPRWDTPGLDFNDPEAIIKQSKNLVLNFSRHPSSYSIESFGQLSTDGSVWLSLTLNLINPLGGESSYIGAAINKLIYDSISGTGLVRDYMKKVDVIFAIIDKARATLMANRNLGEDVFRINAVKIEEIALCADIDIRPDADANKIQAQIFHDIEDFLSPTIYFNRLDEMYAKGKTTDEIFEGPLLEHGFIDEADLALTTRRKTLHVSDLINIMMDIEGVIAVRDVRVANIPLDNDNNLASAKEVKWCLELNVDKQYVPRLTVERSKLLFYKDKLPFNANVKISEELLDDLRASDRRQKLHNPVLDLPVPTGEYREIDSYASIHNDFPLVYGVSEAGLPNTATTQRRAQALQLKGFLMFFDQLLANYLSQLAHVKDIFSLDPGKDINGDYVIDRTYFTQTLVNIVPDAAPLYKYPPATHADHLQEMAEDRVSFFERRNKVLNHLAARFSEQFSDYALLVYNMDGAKAPEELLDDKLAFLNNYPLISSGRDKGFNYMDPAKLWHLDNQAGVARRVSYLAGFDPQPPSELVFSDFISFPLVSPTKICVEAIDSSFGDFIINMGGANTGFDTMNEAKLAAELIVVNGAQPDRYRITTGDLTFTPIEDLNNPPVAPYYIVIFAGEEKIAQSDWAYNTIAEAQDAIERFAEIFRSELLDNPESNRNNFCCIIDRYVDFSVAAQPANPPCPESYDVMYTLYDGHFDATPTPPALLYGVLSDNIDPLSTDTAQVQGEKNVERLLLDMLEHAIDMDYYTYSYNTAVTPAVGEFNVVDRCGKVLATSSETNFTANLRLLTDPMSGVNFAIQNSTANDGTYNIIQVKDNPLNPNRLDYQTNTTIPEAIADGDLTFTLSAPIANTDIHDEGYVDIPTANFLHVVYPGDTIILQDDTNTITYTAVRIESTGMNSSRVYVLEQVTSAIFEPSVYFVAERRYDVVNVDLINGIFTIEHRADVAAAKEMAEHLRRMFLDHEGMHVVEHVLLRPKLNSNGAAIAINSDNRNQLSFLSDVLGKAYYTKQLTYTINSATEIQLTGDYVGDFPANEQFRIIGSTFNNGSFIVTNSQLSGTDTVLTLSTPITDTTNNDGTVLVNVSKFITSYASNGKDIVVDDALFHSAVVYNNLVRISGSEQEQNNGSYTLSVVPVSGDGQHWTFSFNKSTPWNSTLGSLVYLRKHQVYSIDAPNNAFVIDGDYTADLKPNVRVLIRLSPMNDGYYTVQLATYDSVNDETTIKVVDIIADTSSSAGNLLYSVTRPIVGYVTNSDNEITVDDLVLSPFVVVENGEAYIINSRDGVNDGKYVLDNFPSGSAGARLFTFSKRFAQYRDSFLPVDLDADCEACRNENPYSYIVSVILPSWQGRFRNHDFRAFLERSIRLEMPAHIAMNLCWLNCSQMKTFEHRYKDWILENARKVKQPQAITFALDDLIEILGDIRSQYPEGTLHSCDEDPKLKNSIVLNNTALGTF